MFYDCDMAKLTPNQIVRRLKGAPLSIVMLLALHGGAPVKEKFLRLWSGYSYHPVHDAIEFLSSPELAWIVPEDGGWRLGPEMRAFAGQLGSSLPLAQETAQDPQVCAASQAPGASSVRCTSSSVRDFRDSVRGAGEHCAGDTGLDPGDSGLDPGQKRRENRAPFRENRAPVVVAVVDLNINLINNNNSPRGLKRQTSPPVFSPARKKLSRSKQPGGGIYRPPPVRALFPGLCEDSPAGWSIRRRAITLHDHELGMYTCPLLLGMALSDVNHRLNFPEDVRDILGKMTSVEEYQKGHFSIQEKIVYFLVLTLFIEYH